jgi:hypothetical protein
VVSERESVLGFGHNSICRNVERGADLGVLMF